MRSRRTQQQLLPHAHFRQWISCTRSGPPIHVCKWKWMSNTPQGGQRSARRHSGTSLRRLHSRCVVMLSRCSPWKCFCWGNTILSFCLLAASEGGCVTFSGSLPIDTCREFADAPSLLWAEEHPTRRRDEIQREFTDSQLCGMAFTTDLSEEDCISTQVPII